MSPQAPSPVIGREGVDTVRLSRRAGILLAAAAVLGWCVALLLWWQHGLDDALVRRAAARDPASLLVVLAQLASRYGKAAIVAIHLGGLVASLFVESWRRHLGVYLLTLLSLAISGVAGDVLKELLDRPRPAVAHPELSLPARESTTDAFPSGHSTKSLALALPVLLLVSGWRGGRGLARAAVAGLALAVCASRVVLGAHYLSDVVGGLAMALTGLPLAILATNAILRRTTPARLERALWIGIAVYALLIPILVKLS